MRPRPIYRWKSFWLGVLMLAFIGWAWVRSMSWEYYFSWCAEAGWAVPFSSASGEVSLGWHGRTPEASFMLGVTSESLEADPSVKARWFPRYARVEADSQYYRGITVAHWFVMVLVLGTWGGWLGWRARRERMKSMP